MNKELLEAMEVLEKEKNISKDTMIEAIENSLITACKNHFGKADNVRVAMNRTTGGLCRICGEGSCGRGRGFHYGDQSGRCPYDQPK